MEKKRRISRRSIGVYGVFLPEMLPASASLSLGCYQESVWASAPASTSKDSSDWAAVCYRNRTTHCAELWGNTEKNPKIKLQKNSWGWLLNPFSSVKTESERTTELDCCSSPDADKSGIFWDFVNNQEGSSYGSFNLIKKFLSSFVKTVAESWWVLTELLNRFWCEIIPWQKCPPSVSYLWCVCAHWKRIFPPPAA